MTLCYLKSFQRKSKTHWLFGSTTLKGAVKGKNNLLCFQLSADCNFVPGVVHSLWHHIVFVFFQNSNFQQIGPRTILPYVIDTYCYSSILEIYTVPDKKK